MACYPLVLSLIFFLMSGCAESTILSFEPQQQRIEASEAQTLVVELRSDLNMRIDGEEVAVNDFQQIVTAKSKDGMQAAEVHYYWPEAKGMNLTTINNGLRKSGIKKIRLMIYEDGTLVLPHWKKGR